MPVSLHHLKSLRHLRSALRDCIVEVENISPMRSQPEQIDRLLQAMLSTITAEFAQAKELLYSTSTSKSLESELKDFARQASRRRQ